MGITNRSRLFGQPPCMSDRRLEILRAYRFVAEKTGGVPSYKEVSIALGDVESYVGIFATVRDLYSFGFFERVKTKNKWGYRLLPGAVERAESMLAESKTMKVLDAARELLRRGEFPSAAEIARETGVSRSRVIGIRRVLVEAGVWPTKKGINPSQRRGVAARVRAAQAEIRSRIQAGGV